MTYLVYYLYQKAISEILLVESVYAVPLEIGVPNSKWTKAGLEPSIVAEAIVKVGDKEKLVIDDADVTSNASLNSTSTAVELTADAESKTGGVTS